MITLQRAPQKAPLRLAAEAELPTRSGGFRVLAFEDPSGGPDHGVLVRGQVKGAHNVPVRLHSECFTGDVMGSLRCDCRAQLELALARIGAGECGIVVYLPQEGRGIGLANKIRAYALQDEGLDTVDANHALGFADDLRSYDRAADVLKALGVLSVDLLSNNPRKAAGLRQHGVEVTRVTPLRTAATPENARYLATKRRRSGHEL
jgi:GTP cyclohydrolase II